MKCWFSCNHRCRRSRYEEDHRLSEIREEGKQDGGPREEAAGEGCPPRQIPRAHPQPGRALEEGDEPESPAKALQPLDTLSPKETRREAHPPAAQMNTSPKETLQEAHPPATEMAPTPPTPQQEIFALIRDLGAAQERQSRHHRERKKDLRSCHECLKSVKTLKESLREVEGRLWRVEATLGISVPPQELALDLEEGEVEPPMEGGEGEESPLAWAPLPAPPSLEVGQRAAEQRSRLEAGEDAKLETEGVGPTPLSQQLGGES